MPPRYRSVKGQEASYETYLVASGFSIPKNSEQRALMALNYCPRVRHEVGAGVLRTSHRLSQVLQQVGFDIKGAGDDYDQLWSISNVHYGAEEVFAALAPYVTSHSWVQMVSEDQDSWVWVFVEGKLVTVDFYAGDFLQGGSLLHSAMTELTAGEGT